MINKDLDYLRKPPNGNPVMFSFYQFPHGHHKTGNPLFGNTKGLKNKMAETVFKKSIIWKRQDHYPNIGFFSEFLQIMV